MDSWTEIIASYFAPFDKERVASFVAQRRGCSPEELIAEWEHQTHLGTKLHANIENYLLSLPHDESDVFWQFKNFITEHPMVPYRTEWTIYDEESRVAGTIDSLDFHVCNLMLDWKRSKNLIDQDGNVIRDSYNHTMGLGVLSLFLLSLCHATVRVPVYSQEELRHRNRSLLAGSVPSDTP